MIIKHFLYFVIAMLIGIYAFPRATPAYVWDKQPVAQYGDQGLDNSIALDSSGQPHISFREFDYYNLTDNLKFASWDGIAWHVEFVDSTGDVGFASSLSLNRFDQPTITYHDSNLNLKYAKRNNSGWNIVTLTKGANPSLALDKSDRPHISYCRPEYIYNMTSKHYEIIRSDLMYAFGDGQNWQFQTIEQGGRVGEENSLALDSKGYPHIAYRDFGITGSMLKYATWNGTSWQTMIVDSHIVDSYNVILNMQNISIAVDSADRPHISYFGDGFSLKYAVWNGSNWQSKIVADHIGDYELPNSLALDNKDRPHILYRDYVPNSLKYAVWNDNAWQFDTVDSGIVPGMSNSLKLDNNNQPHISYYAAINGEGGGALYYARIGSVKKVTASPPGGLYDAAQYVTLSTGSTAYPFDTIYYTIDGSTPTKNSAIYNQFFPQPIYIQADRITVLKFFAVDSNGNEGQVQTEIYSVDTTKPVYLLTVNKAGSGNGGVLVNNVPLPWKDFSITEKFLSGTTVTLTPQTEFGSVFSGWSGVCSGTSLCQITMDASKNISASYRALISSNGLVAIAAGGYHSLLLNSDGAVVAWGLNGGGQLGNGTTEQQSIPKRVPNLIGIKSIAAGLNHSLAIKSDDTLIAWGFNGNGQLGDGTTTQRTSPAPVTGLSGIKSVAAGAYHTLALKDDGTVIAWGLNGNGQLGDGTTTQRTSPTPVSGLSGITSIAAGAAHSLALKDDGTVYAWGYNGYGRLGDGTTIQKSIPTRVSGLSGVTAISAGSHHTLALKANGSVMAWGFNANNQLGIPFSLYELAPRQVPNLAGITAITAGGLHSLAVKNDGTLFAFGDNGYGQLGVGNTTQYSQPIQVPKLYGVANVSAGAYYSLALRNDGMVIAWGQNTGGQIGDWSTTTRTSPVQVKFTIGLFSVDVKGTIANGVINCTSPVNYNASSICTITPDAGFQLNTFSVNDVDKLSLVVGNSYTINDITSNQTVIGSFALSRLLAVTIATTDGGSGGVNSVPGGINCISGTCRANFANNVNITLFPNADGDSIFSGWSGTGAGACSGFTGNCILNMVADKAVTATFNYVPPVRLMEAPFRVFYSLQSAYSELSQGNTVQGRVHEFIENLILNRSVTFAIKGGYDTVYGARPGFTKLKGSLVIQNGTAILDKVEIE